MRRWDRSGGRESRVTQSTEEAEGWSLETDIRDAWSVDDSAENGTKYHYCVPSVNGEGGERGASNEVSKTHFSDPPPVP